MVRQLSQSKFTGSCACLRPAGFAKLSHRAICSWPPCVPGSIR